MWQMARSLKSFASDSAEAFRPEPERHPKHRIFSSFWGVFYGYSEMDGVPLFELSN